jgi:hypothetical protein
MEIPGSPGNRGCTGIPGGWHDDHKQATLQNVVACPAKGSGGRPQQWWVNWRSRRLWRRHEQPNGLGGCPGGGSARNGGRMSRRRRREEWRMPWGRQRGISGRMPRRRGREWSYDALAGWEMEAAVGWEVAGAAVREVGRCVTGER